MESQKNNSPEPSEGPTPLQSPTTFTKSIVRGLSLKCPACGEGKLYKQYFKKYLKVNDSCEICQQNLSHYPADDAPPYLTIFIVSHIIVPFFLYIDRLYDISISTLLMISFPVTTFCLLASMPLVKGAVIGVLCQLEKRGAMKISQPAEEQGDS